MCSERTADEIKDQANLTITRLIDNYMKMFCERNSHNCLIAMYSEKTCPGDDISCRECQSKFLADKRQSMLDTYLIH